MRVFPFFPLVEKKNARRLFLALRACVINAFGRTLFYVLVGNDDFLYLPDIADVILDGAV